MAPRCASTTGAMVCTRAPKRSAGKASATTLAGYIITQNSAGQIVGYETVGYVAITANLLAVAFVARIVMHDQHADVPDVALK